MKVKELRDLLEVITLEQRIGGENIDDSEVVLYDGALTFKINRVYIPVNKPCLEKILVIS